jgi:MFS family permease
MKVVNSESRNPGPSFAEFVIIVSLMMSLTALSIDAMLPALPQIGSELGIQNVNDRQLIISMIFLGLAVGQLFFGPFSLKYIVDATSVIVKNRIACGWLTRNADTNVIGYADRPKLQRYDISTGPWYRHFDRLIDFRRALG